MPQKAVVRATKPALIAGLIVVLAFFIFGIVFFKILMEEGAGIGMIFMAFWLVVVVLMAGVLIHNWRNYDKNPERSAAEEIVLPDGTRVQTGAGPGSDFNDKLRKLESLKKDGIISPEEFAKKRAEIMEQKW
jgi:hypothetical protein